MSAVNAAISGGGAAAPLLPHLAIRRRSVAARSRAGNCTATRPREFHATPQVPMAVSKTQWRMTVWSVSMLQHLGSNSPHSTRILRIRLVLEIGLDRPFERDQEGVAVAVPGFASRHADPALADAVFLDIGLFGALEADADLARQRVGVIVGAVRVVGETVGWCVRHGLSRLITICSKRAYSGWSKSEVRLGCFKLARYLRSQHSHQSTSKAPRRPS